MPRKRKVIENPSAMQQLLDNYIAVLDDIQRNHMALVKTLSKRIDSLKKQINAEVTIVD